MQSALSSPLPPLPPSPPSVLQVAAAAAGGQHYPRPALYVVATPIGNLADLGLRAIHVLALVDAVACEDTRHTGQLLHHLGIGDKPLLALHRHNERGAAEAVLRRLEAGERVAYVSDAGSPAVSDPGAALVAVIGAAGYRCLPIPGPSSVVTALSVAGDAVAAAHGSGFVFHGFLPAKGAERSAALAAVVAEPSTQVLFEAPHRIEALGAELAAACPGRRVTCCRELTKQFESVVSSPAAELPQRLRDDADARRGEFVLVLHALAPAADGEATVGALAARHDAALATLLPLMPLKQAVALVVDLSGAPRNAVYARALALKGATPAP